MWQLGFDNDAYIKRQSEQIRERIQKYGGKRYLEFGGKLFDDFHASRVLPGFAPDSKIRMLARLKDEAEVVIAINAADIEKNVGISRQFSIFELTRELSMKNSAKALRIAAYIGSSAKFAMPMAVSALYTHFYRILKYGALLMRTSRPANDQKAKVLGVNPYFFSEYDTAVRNYPVKKCMAVVALLKEYDYKGKGGDVGEATPAELMVELTAKILNM